MAVIMVSVISGLFAGFGTGFAGLSAAVFIAPMLIAFLKVDSFSAIGIALASDVLASVASACNYRRYGNVNLRKNMILLVTVLVFAIIGSIIAYFFTAYEEGESIMGWWMIAATLVLGLKLLLFPGNRERARKGSEGLSDTLIMIGSGIYIGFVCGFQGTGGGLMLLFVLNILLGNEFKKAVGTSVSIMALTAFIGAASHFTLRGFPDIRLLILCIVFTFIGAEIASVIANKVRPEVLKRITGGMMSVAGIAMIIARFL
ncbi:MAG: sulfite exporter TauE/SafE family protein [Lachnospiraceae bacterium]|nr:sulfite exporter TauE/SafE family protein [Lachnospiraceae bacterium]